MSVNSALAINLAITAAMNAPFAILLLAGYRELRRMRLKMRALVEANGLEVP